MAEVASAYVSLVPSAQGFGRGVEQQVGGEMRSSGGRLGGLLGTALKVGLLAGVAGVGAAFVSGLKQAAEYEKLQAQTAATLKSTGGAANVTAEGITNLASKIAGYSDGNDDAIQSGQNLLLTFTNIRNEAGKGNKIFDQTTKVMADMSVALGQDTKSSALQLGKALNDPIKGVTALQRVGVAFTEQQKAQIKTLVESGNTIGAQKVILAELNKEFGGSAKALGKTFSGSMGRLKDAFGDLLRDAVMPLLPHLTSLTNSLAKNLPGAMAAVGAAFGRAKAFVAPFVAQIRSMFGGDGGASMFSSLVAAVKPAVAYLRDQLLPAIMGVVNAFKHEFVTLLPIFQAAIAGLIARIAPFWPQIVEGLKQVVTTYKSALELIATIVRAGTAIVTVMWERFGQRFLDYLATTLRNVVTVVRGALNIIQGVIRLVTSLIKGDWSGAWDAIKQIVKGAWQIISGVVLQAINTLRNMFQNLGSVLKVLAAKAWDLVKAAFVAGVKLSIAAIKTFPTLALAIFTGLADRFYDAGGKLVSMLGQGIRDKAGEAIGAVKDLAGKIAGLMPGSPVKYGPLTSFNNGGTGKKLMEMLGDGIIAGTPGVLAAVTSAAAGIQSAVLDHMTSMRDKTKGIIDGLRSDFDSLKGSIVSAFAGNPFEATNAHDFLMGNATRNGVLSNLLTAFKQLKKWGLPAEFLSQLFASGNTDLILSMASSKGDAVTAAGTFGIGQQLSAQLGSAVAQNEIGPELRSQTRELREIRRALDRLPKDFGRELNGAVSHGQKK